MPTKDQQRIEELEGLLAQTTRMLEQREVQISGLDEQIEEMETELRMAQLLVSRVEELEIDVGQCTAHVAMIDRALARLARFIAEATDDDDLWMHVGRDDESRVEVASDAILTLANARDKIVAKPTPKPGPVREIR